MYSYAKLVAPFMGAWIETPGPAFHRYRRFVAPFMGAWIETLVVRKTFRTLKVAPFMGAWIETKLFGSCPIWRGESHPSWVRGLKLRL